MKELRCILIFFLMAIVQAKAQTGKGLVFQDGLSWNQVLAKAKAEKKYIFVDCFATWCGPCKAMEKDTYPLENVGNAMNDKFISVKVQMDTTSGDDEAVRKWYKDARNIGIKGKLTAYPTFLFFSPDGKLVHKDVGYKNEKDLIELASNATNPDKQYYTQVNNFHKGKLDKSRVKAMSSYADQMGDKDLSTEIAQSYINGLSEDELYQKDNLEFMYRNSNSVKQRAFKVFRDHADKVARGHSDMNAAFCKGITQRLIYSDEIKPYKFSKKGKADWAKMEANIKKYGELGASTYKVYKPGLIFQTEIEPALNANPDWTKIYPLIKQQNAGEGEEFVVGSSVVYYMNAVYQKKEKDLKNFILAAQQYDKDFSSFLKADPMNNWAWMVFEKSADKEELNLALGWSKRAMEAEPMDAAYIDTYGNLLYKLGKKQEGIQWEQKAVAMEKEVALQNKMNPREVYKETVDKMMKDLPTWPLE